MKHALYLGKVLGVKIYIHWTFSFLIAWILFYGMRSGLGLTELLWTFALLLAVFACIVLHEFGHAVIAKRFNVITNNITLYPIGGVAQIEAMPEKPKQELMIALAGPAVNLVISLVLYPFASIYSSPEPESLNMLGGGNFLFSLIFVNIWLAVFNLIPAFPMDGGRVLRAALSFRWSRVKATRVAAGIGRFFGVLFFFAGFAYNPMLIFIGLFIFVSGQYESSQVEILQLLRAYSVRDVVIEEIPAIENDATLTSASKTLLGTQNRNFVVMDNGGPAGTITRDEIIKAVTTFDAQTTVDKIKNRNVAYASEDMLLDEVWKIMLRERTPIVLVRSNGNIKGIVEEQNLAEFILLKTGETAQAKRKMKDIFRE